MLKNIHVLIAPKSDESLLNNSDPHRYSIFTKLLESLGKRSAQPYKKQKEVASDFLKVYLSNISKDQHKEYIDQILSSLLNNPDVLKRNLDPSPLSYLEQRGLMDLANKTYGGTVSHHAKKPLTEKAVELAIEFYSNPENSSVSHGCFINTFKNITDKIKDKASLFCKAASLSYATLHKVIKNAVPNLVASKGRDPKQNKDKVSFFLRKEILNT